MICFRFRYTYGKGVAGSVTVVADKLYVWETDGIAISKTTEVKLMMQHYFQSVFLTFEAFLDSKKW